MNNIHGIIACGGNATRFAESVGATSPYPKHLQTVGEKSVLGHSLDGLIGNIGVESVTFTLNPHLARFYIEHIMELQKKYPHIELSYSNAPENEDAGLFTRIRGVLGKDVRDTDGNKTEIGNPFVAIALGDSIVTRGNASALQRDIHQNLGSDKGGSLGIFRDVNNGGLVYWISRVDELGEQPPTHRKGASEYELRWWNCNTLEDLVTARRELGYIPNGVEGTVIPQSYGRERR